MKEIQAFLDKNKAYIADQYDVEQGIAAATRAGISWKDTQLLMGDALNLSILRHESFSDAMTEVIKAAEGQRSSLADLGITQSDLQAPTKAVTTATKEAAAA